MMPAVCCVGNSQGLARRSELPVSVGLHPSSLLPSHEAIAFCSMCSRGREVITAGFGFASNNVNGMTFTAPKHDVTDVVGWMDQWRKPSERSGILLAAGLSSRRAWSGQRVAKSPAAEASAQACEDDGWHGKYPHSDAGIPC